MQEEGDGHDRLGILRVRHVCTHRTHTHRQTHTHRHTDRHTHSPPKTRDDENSHPPDPPVHDPACMHVMSDMDGGQPASQQRAPATETEGRIQPHNQPEERKNSQQDKVCT